MENENRDLVLFEGFPKQLFLTGVLGVIHEFTGLKAAHRDMSEIKGIFKSPSGDNRFVSFQVLFKYTDVFDMIAKSSHVVEDEKYLDYEGYKIKVSLPGEIYYRTKLIKNVERQPEMFTSKIVNSQSANICRWASFIEETLRGAEISSSSTIETESLHMINDKEVIVTFYTERLKDEFQFFLNEKNFSCKTVALRAIPEIYCKTPSGEELVDEVVQEAPQTSVAGNSKGVSSNQTAKKVTHEKTFAPKRKRQFPGQFNETPQSQFNQPMRNFGPPMPPPMHMPMDFNRVRINDETRRILYMLSSPEYEVFVRRVPSYNYRYN